MRSKARRSTTRSLITGKALARHGSRYSSSPSLKCRSVSWHTVVPRQRPVRHAVDHESARAADAFAAIVLERDRLLALCRSALRSARRAFRASTCPDSVLRLVADHRALARRVLLPPDVESEFHLVAPCDGCTYSNVSGSLFRTGARSGPDIPTPPRSESRRRRAAPRPRASGIPRGNGRRRIRSRSSASMHISSPSSKKSATRPAFSSDWLSSSAEPSTFTSLQNSSRSSRIWPMAFSRPAGVARHAAVVPHDLAQLAMERIDRALPLASRSA